MASRGPLKLMKAVPEFQNILELKNTTKERAFSRTGNEFKIKVRFVVKE